MYENIFRGIQLINYKNDDQCWSMMKSRDLIQLIFRVDLS